MADPVSFRLDNELASIARVHAERAGVTLTHYVHELIRHSLGERGGLTLRYEPPGRGEQAKKDFAHDMAHRNQQRVWVWRDLSQRSRVYMMVADLEDAPPLSVRIRAPGGYALSVPRDDIIEWSELYPAPHDRFQLMWTWAQAGAVLHPLDTSGFARQMGAS